MLPSSDSLETLLEKAKELSKALTRLRGAEVTRRDLKESLASLAREWLRCSSSLKEAGCCQPDAIATFDSAMGDLLAGTGTRARASALKKKLDIFCGSLLDNVVVPLIQIEGSPRHVAARQIQDTFAGQLTPEESTYVEEAARCLTVQCFRAAIIMLWAAAIARLHGAVVKRGFDSFNKAVDVTVARKGAPFNKAKDSAKLSSLPELQRSKDSDLLIIGMELFNLDLQAYQELDRLLGIRNDCAHPGMNQPGALDVQQFASKLRTYVFNHVTP